MVFKSIIIIGSLASLVLAAPVATAQGNSRRAYCDDYARRVAYREGDPGAVVGGVVGGAVLGGLIGAVTGQGHASNVGTGAAIGGVTGGVLGAAGSHQHIDRRAYNEAYWQCVNQSQRVYDRPIHNSRQVEYCISRYRSYNPNTGLYLSSSGNYRHCPN